MFWGDSIMSFAEHILNGEIILYSFSLTKSGDKTIREVSGTGTRISLAVFYFLDSDCSFKKSSAKKWIQII